MPSEFAYDVFLSHSSKDKAVVRELAKRLRRDGLRVWFDEWEVKPGDIIGLKVEQGLEQSRVLVLCMSKNAFASDWVTLERHSVMFRDPTNAQRRFIPLLLEDTAIKETLKQFAYVDWRQRVEDQYSRLLAACPKAEDRTPQDTNVPVVVAMKTVSLDLTAPAIGVEVSSDGHRTLLESTDSVRTISLGHTGYVRSVALSGDGRRALSGSDDKTVRVWDTESGRCLAALEGHTDSVFAVASSGDGRRVLSGSADNTVRVWDAVSEQCVATLEGHTADVLGVALSSDGHRALSGSHDKTVRVWDAQRGRCLATLEGHTASVLGVALSCDGRRALSGSADKTLRVWDIESGRCLAPLKGHTAKVLTVALSADGRRALSGSHDKTVRVWDAEGGRCLATLEGHTASVLSVALSADGHRALSGSADKTLRVWDTETGQCLATLKGHTASVRHVALSGDGRRALSGSADTTVRVWDTESGRCLATLERHVGSVRSVALSGDGHRALSGSANGTVRVWDAESGLWLATLEGHTASVLGVALSGDGRRALSGSHDKTVRVWDAESGQCLATLEGHSGSVRSAALSGDGRRAVSGSVDSTVRVWDTASKRCLATLEGHAAPVWSVALSADGRRALSGSADRTVRVWDTESKRCLSTLEGHTAGVLGVALSGDGRRALSGSADKTVRVWDADRERCLATLEGHTASVLAVALSVDGRRALSGSHDKTVRVWDTESGRCLATLEGHGDDMVGVALSRDGRRALSGAVNGVARVWSLPDSGAELPARMVEDAHYTNAKVLLVGESGVGKTGLMYRIAEDCFKDSISTDAVWATQLKLPHAEEQPGIEREVWLWDFAGQADYRLIQQLYMDQAALAVLVFNPQSENPFEGLGQWDRDLQRAARRPFRKLLVAGRVDRGGLMVSSAGIERFRQERGYTEYIETSAVLGTGCKELHDAIIRCIPWEDLNPIVSPRIFKLLKDEIIRLKDEGKVLLRMSELKQQLEMRLPGEDFTVEQLGTVAQLLAGPGVVWELEFGSFVLLQPERINAYAAAVIRSVRAHTEEIGCIAEQDVLDGRLDYQDMKRLPADEERIVLLAMHQTFLDHGLCMREHTDRGTFLIFPSYFKRERPELQRHPAPVVTYHFSGPLDEIYATLVVRLHHTVPFESGQLWRFAADFKTPGGQQVGLKMVKKAEGSAEITIYCDPKVPAETQVTFILYVDNHLKSKSPDVKRERHYVCGDCGSAIENRRAVQDRLQRGEKDIVCSNCEKRVTLWDLIEEKFASDEMKRLVRELDEQSRAAIDNESRELASEAHTMLIVAEAGQIWRRTEEPDWGIDGEIEFKDDKGEATGERLYVQLKSGDSFLRIRKADGEEIFTIKNERHVAYWQQQAYPVMLVIRTSDGTIRWMDVSAYLKRETRGATKPVKQIIFKGEPLTALNILKMRRRILGEASE